MNIRGLIFDFYNVIYIYQNGDYRLNQELLEFVKELKPKFKLGIISNIVSKRLPYQDELEKYFDLILTSGATGHWKPEPEIYQLAAQNLHLAPNEIAIIDDSQGHLEGAKKVGMQTIYYENLEKLKTDLETIANS